ncbi:MAG: hypothetical protein KAH44_09435 [Oricola sp.]|jgi:hypothetical protein|nr:hypothetical protein [Oricola sp.]
MKAVLYFSAGDLDKARLAMAKLKVAGYSIHWAPSDDFNDPRDMEVVDEVFLVSEAPKVEAAYAARGVKVTKAFDDAPTNMLYVVNDGPVPVPDQEPPIADAAESEEPETPSRRRGRKRFDAEE